jgi:hypothetical protein
MCRQCVLSMEHPTKQRILTAPAGCSAPETAPHSLPSAGWSQETCGTHVVNVCPSASSQRPSVMTHSCCRLVSPANSPTLTAVSWLVRRSLLCSCLLLVPAPQSEHPDQSLTHSNCRLVSPSNSPTLTPVSWLLRRFLFN